MVPFTRTLSDVVQDCFNNRVFFQGQDFQAGFYCREKNGIIEGIDGNNNHQVSHPLTLSKHVFEQKYRTFQVASQREINNG